MKELETLEGMLGAFPGIVTAYSGGMDSGFLALAAARFKPGSAKCVFVRSEFISSRESENAISLARDFGLELEILDVPVLETDFSRMNPPDRCYWCKKTIFQVISKVAPESWVICEGSNTDDLDDFRPGRRAMDELGIRSPLLDAGFSKDLIRKSLVLWNAEGFIRAPQACLATRISCGVPISKERLAQVEKGERILGGVGLSGVRLRHHGDLARIELDPKCLGGSLPVLRSMVGRIKALGFRFVTLDLEGYRRGSMNPEAGDHHEETRDKKTAKTVKKTRPSRKKPEGKKNA